MELLNQIILGLIISAIFITFIRIRERGFFWRDRKGKELSFKQFKGRFKEGVVNITPLQQTTTSLWSMIPIFAGLLWGMAVTFISGIYWMTLILTFSLPLIFMNFISTLQKFRAQKKAKELMDELEKNDKKLKRKWKKK